MDRIVRVHVLSAAAAEWQVWSDVKLKQSSFVIWTIKLVPG
jgi:hypothetical protein